MGGGGIGRGGIGGGGGGGDDCTFTRSASTVEKVSKLVNIIQQVAPENVGILLEDSQMSQLQREVDQRVTGILVTMVTVNSIIVTIVTSLGLDLLINLLKIA